MGEKINTYTTAIRKPEGKKLLGRPMLGGRIILKK
jgi:hypothetical protein